MCININNIDVQVISLDKLTYNIVEVILADDC